LRIAQRGKSELQKQRQAPYNCRADQRGVAVTNVFTLRQPGAVEDHGLERNPGMAYTPELFDHIRINRSAVERRAATIAKRRSIKKDYQTAWLLKAITCMDLTTLAGDDTPGKVRRLCAKARQPVRKDILQALGVSDLNITTGAVCVYHNLVATAVRELEGSGIPVAAVSTGFPAGQIPLPLKIAQIHESVKAIQNAGINVLGNFIFGLPDDTLESMRATLDLAKSLECEYSNFYSAMGYPGSKLFDESRPEDLPDCWAGYSQHAYETRPLPTETLDSTQVLRFRDEAFHEYFTDPAYLEQVERN